MKKPKVTSIKIDKFGFPAQRVSPIEPLLYAYNTMPIVDENPRLIISGREFKTTVKRVKLLKALAMATVNANKLYSDVMLHAMKELIQSIVYSKDDVVIPMSVTADAVTTVLISSINNFIREEGV